MADAARTYYFGPTEPTPNWAEKSGVVNFLNTALEKTKYDYQQEVTRKMEEQKAKAQAAAEMAKVQAQSESYEKQEKIRAQGGLKEQYLKSIYDRYANTTDPDEKLRTAKLISQFTQTEGLYTPQTPTADEVATAQKHSDIKRRAMMGDFSDFAGSSPESVKAVFQDWFPNDRITADKMYVQYEHAKTHGKLNKPATTAPKPQTQPWSLNPAQSLYNMPVTGKIPSWTQGGTGQEFMDTGDVVNKLFGG